uniref:RRM domain-containing protein n=1 Tax=Panagrolaimus sp. JU765 TaxID=591449 RepID=A0AC34PXJ4_9BILA
MRERNGSTFAHHIGRHTANHFRHILLCTCDTKEINTLASLKLESAIYGAVGGPHQGLIYSANPVTVTRSQPFPTINQPPEAKRARIDTPPSSSELSPTGMANAGASADDYNQLPENVKLKSATSVDSLDNCSTVSSGDPSSQVRTLFVSGLPMDTKPRELYLLFRAYQGYESSLLKVNNKNGKSSAPVGFVTFATRQDADEAKRRLSGVRFDPEINQPIRLELARSNTKVNKPKQPSPPAFTANLGITPTSSFDTALLGAAAANGMLTMPLQGLPLIPGANAQFLQPNATLAAMAALQQQQLLAANLNLLGNAQSGANPPCSTLFVANLGSNPNEDELRQLFKKFPGFCRLRLNNKSSAPVAFVEFSDVRQASYALANLQGAQLASSERGGGIRIEYAKTKMGEGSSSQTLSAPFY